MSLGELVSNPFEHIKERLFDYKTNPDVESIKELRMLIQSYLREMNSNTNTPLSHRLRVIDALGSYITILQEIGVPNLLESYDKVIAPIAERADKKPLFAEALVELAALSYHLTLADLQRTLMQYRPVSLVSIRRALSLMHTVLKIFRKHRLPSTPWLVRLTRLYVLHELLRMVNTYAMTTEKQKSAIMQLHKHMEGGLAVNLRFFFAGEHVVCTGLVLMTDPQKPHASPVRSLRYDAVIEHDTIVIDLDAMAQKSLAEMRHAEKKTSPQHQGQRDDYVVISNALRDAIALGDMMREVMYTRPRQHPRHRPQGKKSVALQTKLDKGLRHLYKQQRYLNDHMTMKTPDAVNLWHVVDISDGGFYLEQMPIRERVKSVFSAHQYEDKPPPMEVGIVVSYALIEPATHQLKDNPQVELLACGIAKISWFRINSNDLKTIGVAKVMRGEITQIKRIREMNATTPSDQFYAWVETVDDTHKKLWSTQSQLTSGAPIAIGNNNELQKGRVVKMIERGVNYVVHLCKMDTKDGTP
ncbi:MAG: hypothetical protein Q9M22_02545 [Mariprofundaceae bacterium]|nr:hypothetical protein [Mariprofundaceae bacterium]